MGHGKRAGENDESAIRFACDLLDGIFEIGSAAHRKRNYLHTRRQGPFKVRELPLHGVCRIVNNSNADCTWRYFPEHLSPFCSEAVLPESEPGYVASRSRWARDQAGGDRIAHLCEYDRQGAGSVLQRHHGRLIAGENSIRPHPHEFGSEASQALVIPAWPALLDVDIATFDPPEILQARAERRHAELAFGVLLRQPRNQHADAVHLLALLGARRQRPRRRAAEERDELAPSHSINSSACSRKASGIVRPIAFAVRMLTASCRPPWRRAGCGRHRTRRGGFARLCQRHRRAGRPQQLEIAANKSRAADARSPA